jgi:hypothetical protein
VSVSIASAQSYEDDVVLAILEAAGQRGASHEDFVEAGLARSYVSALRRLVDDRGLDIRIDFTTGAARWAVQRAAAALASRAA